MEESALLKKAANLYNKILIINQNKQVSSSKNTVVEIPLNLNREYLSHHLFV